MIKEIKDSFNNTNCSLEAKNVGKREEAYHQDLVLSLDAFALAPLTLPQP